MTAIQTDQLTARTALQARIRDQGRLPLNGVVRIAAIDSQGDFFVRLTLESECLTLPPLPGDAVKIFLPGADRQAVPAPQYDPTGVLLWPQGIARPQARCFTALDWTPGGLHVDILRHEHGFSSTWLNRAGAGDQLGITGYRPEFVPADNDAAILVGDASALPTMAAVARANAATTIVAFGPTVEPLANSYLNVPFHIARDRAALTTLLRDRANGRRQVWLGAERDTVRLLRPAILETGIARDMLHASVFWRQGSTWEQVFDTSLQRFQSAADAGEDVTDPAVFSRFTLE